MSAFDIDNIINSNDRYKLFHLSCTNDNLIESIGFLQTNGIQTINIGKELSSFIVKLEDFSYLNIDVFDFLRKTLDKYRAKIKNTGNDIVAIYNLGILLEPSLELNAVQLLKDFSKTAALIIIWENNPVTPNWLNWPTQQNNIFLDFTETPLKTLHYAI
jgi:L-rhamnose isomerase